MVSSMNKASRVGFWIVAVSLALACLVLSRLGWPVLYEVPPNLQGWFTVQYDDNSCQPLARKGLYRVVVVRPNRFACTSSPIEMHWHFERFEYVMPDGQTALIPDGVHGVDNRVRAWNVSWSLERHQGYVYIGPESEVATGNPPYAGFPPQPDPPKDTR
jgi:hypothetical protein